MTTKTTVGCIGTGAMGGALMKAASQTIGGDSIAVYDINQEKAAEFAKSIGAKTAASIEAVLTNCEIIFLAVKPNIVPSVLSEIKLALHNIAQKSVAKRRTLVSMAAGISITTISDHIFGSIKIDLTEDMRYLQIIRIMPNMPAMVGEGMIALSAERETNSIAEVKSILAKAGKIEQVPESLMDAVTAVSGSGPAFGFIFIEAMADAAVQCGMSRNQAIIYAAQTLKGSAEAVLVTKRHPADLKDAVCSPAGTTINGVAALEEKGFRSAIIAAVKAAFIKSRSFK